MSHYPRVIACMPTWNGEKFIEETLVSLKAQTYPNLKVLISDDGSTDRTSEICRRFALESRFTYILQKDRLGWIGNMNRLYRMVSGDYVFFSPHDDPLYGTYVEALVEALEKDKDAILAYSDIELCRLDGTSGPYRYLRIDGLTDRVERTKEMIRMSEGWWVPHRGLFRTGALSKIGGLRRNLAGEFCADWPWLVHMAMLGKFIRVPEVLYRKQYRAESLSVNWKRNRLKWTAAALGCAREVRLATLPWHESSALYVEITKLCAQWWTSRRRIR